MKNAIEAFRLCVRLGVRLELHGSPASLRVHFPPGTRDTQLLREILNHADALVRLLDLTGVTAVRTQDEIVFLAASEEAREILISHGANPTHVFGTDESELERLFSEEDPTNRELNEQKEMI